MKVLQINVVCGQGSTGRIAVDIANMLKSKGDKAYIAYGYGTTDYPESYKITTDLETRINVHLFSRLGRQGRGTKYRTRKMLKWIDMIKPDIIHLHNIHGSYVNYPLLFEYIIRNNIPVVWTIHDCWPVTGSCAHFVMAQCNKWKTGCTSCTYDGIYKEKSLIDSSEVNYVIKKNLFTSVPRMLLVPVSRWMNNVIKESFLNGFQSVVIYNGIDLDVFRFTPSNIKERLGVSGKHLLLGVASQWGEMKGLNDFIRLAALLSDEYVIVLVGLSEAQIKILPATIIGIERTKNMEELVELYSAADVVVSLSYAESMGLTLVEGMACGTPVITYDNTAQSELVTQETGAVVRTGDIKLIVESLSRLMAIGRESFSVSCRERVQKMFNKNSQYLDYYNQYKTILNC